MAREKGSLFVRSDLSEMSMMEGVLQGLSTTVESDRFITPVVENAHVLMANEFDLSMDLKVEPYLDRYHHVYEWWNSPLPWDQARLWRHELKGAGANNRIATWSWKASKTPIPDHYERKSYGSKWSSHLEDQDIDMLSKRKYIFYWKAPIMEYNTPVKVRPRYAKQLFVPTPRGAPKNRFTFRDEITINNPGGEETTGAFTAAWVTWWSRTGPLIMEESVEKSVKQGVEKATIKALKKGSQKRSVSISTIVSHEVAMQNGVKWIQKELYDYTENIDWGDLGL